MTALSRTQLARRAFVRACDQLEADRDAGLVSAADAVIRFKRLRDAYETRKQDIELAGFLTRHGLQRSVAMRGVDLALNTIERASNLYEITARVSDETIAETPENTNEIAA